MIVATGCATAFASRNPQNLIRAKEQYLLKEYSQAALNYEKYLADNPGDPRRAVYLTWLGKCYLGANNPALAIASFDQALVERPDPSLRWEILFRRAVAYRMRGDNSRALEDFRAAAAAPVAERTVTSDALHYEYAISLFRVGDWKAGQAQLAAVNPRGEYAAKVAPRRLLTAFTVQTGAFSDPAHAEALVAKLKSLGLAGAVQPVPGDKPLYLATVGRFERYEDARREAERLKQLGFSDAFVIP